MKEVVTGDNYKQIVLKRMIILCWVLLAICFFVKLFGGNFFAFIGESEVAEYIEKHFWLLTIVQFVFYLVQSFLYYLVVFKDKHKCLIVIFTAIMFTFKVLSALYEQLFIFAMIVEILFLIIIPIIMNKKEWYVPLVLYGLMFVYQLISLFVKNINIISFPDTNIVGYVYMIDYYIMLGLTYLYFKKGDFKMGRLGFIFLSKDKEQLEAYKEVLVKRHEKKVAKHNEKINKIEEKIAKC